MEYTLEDAFETLKDKKVEQEKNMEDLINRISNNEIYSVKPSSSVEDIKMKQNRLYQSLLNEIEQVEFQDYPIPRTCDLRLEVIMEMEEEIQDMRQLLNNLENKLSNIQNDIAYLKNKKSGFDKMQKAYLDVAETLANRTYEEENIVIKHIFKEVKKDLHTVVGILFPNNTRFNEFLAKLTTAYLKGGDDVFVAFESDTLDCVNFLLEADIVQYHRNDKTKIRITELL